MQNIPMRDAFWSRVYELAHDNRDIVIVTADMGSPALDKYRRDFPNRFVNVGIAEQNAIAVAAGLTLGGKKVFVYAIAPFITMRCYEQIKVLLATMNLAVTVVGVGAGYSYDDAGPTHHAVEDLSIMRILPHMTVNNITDSVMARAFAARSLTMTGPNYVRLDRKLLPNLYKEDSNFDAGLEILRPGQEVYIIATGNMVHQALSISEELSKQSVVVGVIDIYTLPINKEALFAALAGVKKIITLEEHLLPGGLGSAVCEALADNGAFIPVKRMGIDCSGGYCFKYGGRQNIQAVSGLDIKTATRSVLEFVQE